jgi:methyl-accepting chemotaxis protein
MKVRFGASNNLKKRQAFECMQASVMISDKDLNITYMNPSLTRLLAEAEVELKRELPHFSMATLIGSNIDIFHKNPSHQRNMLARLETTHHATIKVGKRMFDLVVNPLKRGGRRIGFVVEWSDAAPRLRNLDYAAQNAAFSRTQSIISFFPDGQIITANENFLKLMGYSLEEVVGKYHSMFVAPEVRQSRAYAEFWEKLARGEYQTGEFKRFLKGGRTVWLQGLYNPILNTEGKVVRVEKFAVDVTRRISSVLEIGAALADLAAGDLQRRITEPLQIEVDQLRTDYNLAVDRLQESMQRVRQSSAAIKNGTEEIRTAADDLSARTERQAASLEETAAALDEVTAAVKSTSENAGRARAVVDAAKADAEVSAVVVRKAVGAMRAIESSSQQISQIIGVIDEIAFQTNLLALNAGVEAARAGDAGRGFAVVASEVRALAQRSAEAAKEIKALISTSAEQVGQGVDLVVETGDVLDKIIAQVSEINVSVATIASSAKEQANGLDGVNKSVNEMDRVTQQNAAMVAETTSAARALSDQTSALNEQVEQFRLGGERPAPVQRGARAAQRRLAVVRE